MRLFARQGRGRLSAFAAMSAVLAVLAVSASGAAAQSINPGGDPDARKIAVCVTGDAPEDKKRVLAVRLFAALVKTGRYGAIELPADFMAAAAKEYAAVQGAEFESYLYRLAKQFGARFVCIANIDAMADDSKIHELADNFMISARVVDVETLLAVGGGNSGGQLKTAGHLRAALDELIEEMFPPVAEAPAPAPAPPPQSAYQPQTQAYAADDVPASAAAVSVTGDAKTAVDKVVAAVNAFKDATAKSIAAVNAVKTAAQSKNFSAIMDAKKKVTSAAEAVKQAKADVTAAIDALNAAGPEAAAAVKAMGIDISMFVGKGGGGGTGGGDDPGESEPAAGKIARSALIIDIAPVIVGLIESGVDNKVGAFGIGLQYELKLSPYFGLATRYDVYGNWNSSDYPDRITYSISSWEWHARTYPTGKTFFLDAMAGYYTNTVTYPLLRRQDNYYSSSYYGDTKTSYSSGKIGASLGWRMRFGREKGFTWELAFGFRYSFIETDDYDYDYGYGYNPYASRGEDCIGNRMFGGSGPRVVSAFGWRF